MQVPVIVIMREKVKSQRDGDVPTAYDLPGGRGKSPFVKAEANFSLLSTRLF